MADLKLDAPEGPHADAAAIADPRRDWIARAAIVLVFMLLTMLTIAGFRHIMPLDSAHKLLMAAARVANVMFLSLVAATALTRLAPVLKAHGLEPRVSALLGTFLSMALAALPKAELGPVLSVLSTLLIMAGATLSFIVLRWLGKSFSILAEARQLVTAGPYRIVRHPLYVCEAVALAGLVLQVLSPLAVLVGVIVLAIQYRRMINEEAVLRAAFPAYAAYAMRTPRVLPAANSLARGLPRRPTG